MSFALAAASSISAGVGRQGVVYYGYFPLLRFSQAITPAFFAELRRL